MQKNKGVLYINHQIREKGKKICIFDKVNMIKKDIKVLLPEIEDDKLLAMMSHCRSYYEGKLHYGRHNNPENHNKVKEMTASERVLYDFLLKTNLNPSTTYRWFLACRVAGDIREKLEKGKISYKIALQINANRKRVIESNTGLLMVEEINNLVRSL